MFPEKFFDRWLWRQVLGHGAAKFLNGIPNLSTYRFMRGNGSLLALDVFPFQLLFRLCNPKLVCSQLGPPGSFQQVLCVIIVAVEGQHLPEGLDSS